MKMLDSGKKPVNQRHDFMERFFQRFIKE